MLLQFIIIISAIAAAGLIFFGIKNRKENSVANVEPIVVEPEVKEEVPLGYETDAVKKPKKTRKPRAKKATKNA